MSLVHIARCPKHGRMPEEHARCRECDQPLEQVEMIPADYFRRDELEWLESAARTAAGDKIARFAKATDDLLELARKVRLLRAGGATT